MISPSAATFLITIINIGVLFFILRAILFKPVSSFMEARTKKIEEALANAEREKAQAKMLLEQRNTQLKQASLEAEKILKSAREKAEKQADVMLSEAKAQAEILVSNGRKQVEAERQAAVALFKAEAAALVVAASGRLLKRELRGGDEAEYARILIEELGRSDVPS
ncbi:MAG: F0F1 ATP synthase subunit B [Treponema sp.]|jgi:F-type H+-transporting ATPase subunit b|nr:F0F1 ATP synthase subunit B [Treponema sp.]